ncbi:ParA family protein [Vibrio splendidus]
MKLEKYKQIGNRASLSLKQRADESRYLRSEVSERYYSQQDVVSFLKFTDKKVSKTSVSNAMDELKVLGHEFNQPKGKGYLLTIDNVIAIADHLGVTKYHGTTNGKAFVICFLNLKGGVGKSMCTNMFAHFLTCHKRFILSEPKVLIIDLDPQGTSTQHNTTIYKIDDHSITSLTALLEDMSIEEIQESAIKRTEHRNLDIILAGTDDGFLADQLNTDEICNGSYVAALLQERLISKLDGIYDFILVDVGPHMDNTLKNVLWASDQLIVPVPQTYYPYDSSCQFLTRLPGVMAELVDNGLSESDLPDMTAFITLSPIDTQVEKESHNTDKYTTASTDLARIFDLDNLNSQLPEEDVYERCIDMGQTVFSLQKKDYPGDSKAFVRAYNSAQRWGNEIADIVCVKHGAK